MQKNALSGLRIIDFTWVLAGPYATRLLADFGAEVIKIQSKKTAKGAESNLTAYFATWNRNKRSITLDMSYPEAKEIVLRLAGISDAVIENYSPRVMENWELHYEKLREINPRIIMARISAMGQTGPWKDYVAYGATLQSLTGISYMTAFRRDDPLGIGYAYGDHVVGLFTVFAVLAALECRDRTGQGCCIDLSGYEALCATMGPALLHAALNGKPLMPQGNRPCWGDAAPYGCYKCSGEDRWCVIAVFNDDQWYGLCQASGNLHWAKDTRFASFSGRKENEKELDELLSQWTAQYAPEEIVGLLQEAGLSSGIVQDADDLANDPELAAREFFLSLDHPVLGRTVSDRSPIRFKDNDSICRKAAPLLGEANQYVYRELLGFTEKQISDYIERGIIG